MPFSSAVGSVATPLVAGQFSVTGLSFQPKALILYWTVGTADGAVANMTLGFGGAVSDTSQFVVYNVDLDAVATVDSGRKHDSTRCYADTNTSGTFTASASFVSFNSDGFTLNLVNESGEARIINYIALGGTTLTNAAIKAFQSPGSVSTVGYTGVGFTPDAVLFFSAQQATASPNGGSATAWLSAGFATATAQVALNARTDDSDSVQDASHGQNAAIALLAQNPAASISMKATLASLDADGFTLTYSASSTAAFVYALCLKGGSYNVGEISQKTSTGTQAYTGVGFKPSVVMLLSANDATDSDTEAHYNISTGAATFGLAQGSVWAGSVDAADPTQSDSYLDRTNVIRMMTAGTPSTEAIAAYTSSDNDGFTLNWTTADATARKILYLAIGPAHGGGGGGGGGNRPPRPPGGGPPGQPPGGGTFSGPVLKKIRFPEKVI